MRPIVPKTTGQVSSDMRGVKYVVTLQNSFCNLSVLSAYSVKQAGDYGRSYSYREEYAWFNGWNFRRFGTRDEMMRHRLRLFTGEEDTSQTATENVTVRLGDISRALLDATRWNRTWVSDFADDEIQVSSDLYEILSTYMRLRPGA